MIREILDDYGFWERMIRKKKREIDLLREKMTSITVNNDGLPRGTNRYTMNDYVSDLEELQEELEELQSRQLRAYDDIMRLLVVLDGPRSREILYRRYISLWSWKKIRKATKLSKTRCYDLHRDAIGYLEKRGVRDL